MDPQLMKKRNQAFAADFIIFTLLALVGEFISQKALQYFQSNFFFSIAALPLFILFYRWGIRGVPSIFIFGIASSIILTGATFKTFIVNILGYPGFALGMLLFIRPGRENVKLSIYFAFLYVLAGFTGMVILRSLILTAFEADILSNILLIASNESLSFIACTLLFILMRKRTGYLVYLPAVYREKDAADKEEIKHNYWQQNQAKDK